MPRDRRGLWLRLAAASSALVLAAWLAPRAVDAGGEHPRLLPVPLISQAKPFTCGAASLMAALVYFGVFDDPESRLDAELGATPEQGVAPQRIAVQARTFGLTADVRTGLTLDDLTDEVGRGSIVIVALQAWPSRPTDDPAKGWENGHYIVIVGLDSGRVYAMDPSVRTGYAFLPRDEFVERWHDYDVIDGRREAYSHLGIVLRGPRGMQSYPGAPTKIE